MPVNINFALIPQLIIKKCNRIDRIEQLWFAYILYIYVDDTQNTLNKTN